MRPSCGSTIFLAIRFPCFAPQKSQKSGQKLAHGTAEIGMPVAGRIFGADLADSVLPGRVLPGSFLTGVVFGDRVGFDLVLVEPSGFELGL